MEFKFEGIDTVVLPDEFLLVEQIERGYRALIADGTEKVDVADPKIARKLTEAIIGEKTPDFSQLPASPSNMQTLFRLYAHVGNLFAKSMSMGDEVVQEVEAKKEKAGQGKKKPVRLKTTPSQSK